MQRKEIEHILEDIESVSNQIDSAFFSVIKSYRELVKHIYDEKQRAEANKVINGIKRDFDHSIPHHLHRLAMEKEKLEHLMQNGGSLLPQARDHINQEAEVLKNYLRADSRFILALKQFDLNYKPHFSDTISPQAKIFCLVNAYTKSGNQIEKQENITDIDNVIKNQPENIQDLYNTNLVYLEHALHLLTERAREFHNSNNRTIKLYAARVDVAINELRESGNPEKASAILKGDQDLTNKHLRYKRIRAIPSFFSNHLKFGKEHTLHVKGYSGSQPRSAQVHENNFRALKKEMEKIKNVFVQVEKAVEHRSRRKL